MPISNFRRPTKKTTAQWTSILHLAAKWGFENIKLLAIDNLTAHATSIDKIVLGRRYDITYWLPAAYEAVCMREDPLTIEEGMKLGIKDIVKISAARQVYGTSTARYATKHLGGDIADIFGLGHPAAGDLASRIDEEDAIKDLQRQIDEADKAEKELDLLPPSKPLGDCGSHKWLKVHPEDCLDTKGSLHTDGLLYKCKVCNGDWISNEDKESMKDRRKRGKHLVQDLKSRLEITRRELISVEVQRRQWSTSFAG